MSSNAGSAFFEGGAGHYTIQATDNGNDTMEGGDGDDSLDGGTQAYTLSGGSGSDTITGGTSDDNLTGGGGGDTFAYTSGDGNDTITDFNAGNTGTLDDGNSTNNGYIDLSGYYDHISELYADQADDGILNQSNTTDTRGQTTDYSDNDQFGTGEGITFQGVSADDSSFTQENTNVVCFASGTPSPRTTARNASAVQRTVLRLRTAAHTLRGG